MADEEIGESPKSGLNGGVIGGAVVLVALVVFVVQNTTKTKVTWLFFESNETPVWLVIVIAAVAGAILSELAGWLFRRRKRG